MSQWPYTTADLAAELGVSRKTIRAWAAPLGIGLDRDGRAGFVYSEADRRRLIESRTPVVTPRKQRSRKRGRAA